MAKAKAKKRSVVKLIRKSNDLVEAKYKFDIWETRIFTKMLTLIHPDDKDFKEYRIYLHEVINDFELKKNKDAYEWLKRGARKLMTKIISVIRETDEGPMEFQTPITVGVENPLNPKKEEMSYVDVSFHPKMKPYLLALQSKFTIYDVRNILNLPSAYSIRIYELLKQYEKIGRRKIGLTELKEIIGVIEETEEKGKKQIMDSYPLYGNFRQRVLLKSQRDLEKYTDIKFDFEPIKRGRKVFQIQFYIHSNRKSKTKEVANIEEQKIDVNENPVVVELSAQVGKWMNKESLKRLLNKHPESQVRNAITITLNRLKRGDEITNIAGHIVQLSKQTTLFDTVEIKQKAAKQKKEKAKELTHKKEELSKLKKQLETERFQKELEVIDRIMEEYPVAREIVLLKVQSGMFGKYYDAEKSFEDNCNNQLFLTAYRGAVKKEFASEFDDLKKEYEPRLRKLKQVLQQL